MPQGEGGTERKISNCKHSRSSLQVKSHHLLPSSFIFNIAEASNPRTEHIRQAQKHSATISAASTITESSDAPASPIKIPEMRYHEISLNGKTFELALVRQLSWLSLA